jgi:hypothetical protein
MLQDQKVRQHQKQEPVKPEKESELEAHAYSNEFLASMYEQAYNTLHNYLVAQGVESDAVEMLDNLLQLASIQRLYDKQKLVLYIWNNEASYCIGRISHAVPKLGGHFPSESGVYIDH